MNEITVNGMLSIGGLRNSVPIPNKPNEARFSGKYVAFVLGKTERRAEKVSVLVGRIRDERASIEIEDGQDGVADRAVEDAITMVENSRLGGTPRVMQSSDGILALEWHSEDEGAALFFGGNGVAALSVRVNGGLYEGTRQIGIRAALPGDFVALVARLSH